MLCYTTFLSFNWTSSMTSIINWPHYSIFSVDFFPTFPKIEILPVQKGIYSKKGKRPANKHLHILENFLSKSYAKLVLLTFPKIWSFSNPKNCLFEKQHRILNAVVKLTARWYKQRTKNGRNSSLIREKHLILQIMKYQIEWRQREAFLRDQAKGKFSLKIKTTYPRSQNTLSELCSQTIKALLLWTEQLKAKILIIGNSKKAQCEETGSELKQDSRLAREDFQPSNLADDAFRKEKTFHWQKLVSSRNLPQMVLGKNIDVCGKKCLKEKRPVRFKSFFFSRIALSSWNFLNPPRFQIVFFLREKSDFKRKAISGNNIW